MPVFDSLPAELIATIFSKLDKPSLVISRIVCSDWKNILDNFFFKATVLLTNQSTRSVRNTQLNIETLQVRNFTRDDYFYFVSLRKERGGARFPDNGLRVEPKNIIFMRKASKDLKHASVTSQNILHLLELNPNLEFLFFDFNSLVFVSLSGIRDVVGKFQYLKQLKICFNSTEGERQNLELLTKVKFRVLKTLQLFGRFQSSSEDSAQIYVYFYQIVANHKESLQVVNLVHPIWSTRRDPTDALPVLPVSGIELDELVRNLSQIQLKGIYINFDQNEGIFPGFDLGFNLVQNQSHLENLHAVFRDNIQVTTFPISETIQKNSSSLNCVDLIANKRGSPLVNLATLGSLNSLGSCPNLSTLRLVNFKIPRFSNQFLFKLPSSLTTVLLWGHLGGIELLDKVQTELPKLERLEFYDTDGNQVGNSILAQKLKRLLGGSGSGNGDRGGGGGETRVPRPSPSSLQEVYWHKRNFKFDCLEGLNGIEIKPFSISTAWSWPLKKSILSDTYRITITQ